MNSLGWSFSILLRKKFKLSASPGLPDLRSDTSKVLEITLSMNRDRESGNAFEKDIDINMKKTPGSKPVAMASIFKEYGNAVELKLTFATEFHADVAVTQLNAAWDFSFDMDHGYLAPVWAPFKATHLIFYPGYPAHTFPSQDSEYENGYVVGNPEGPLVAEYLGIHFVKLSDSMRCQMMTQKGKTFWQLAAVGWIKDDHL